ncbi:MAG: hypothetical protein IT159_13090 [Bryobacterales bacterium]|nr:hypothetical protein [Bryobacterales bacterium]
MRRPTPVEMHDAPVILVALRLGDRNEDIRLLQAAVNKHVPAARQMACDPLVSCCL